MKKLVFTALAVVAFSGVSMAKSVEIKKEVVTIIMDKVDLVVENENEATPCQNRAIDTYVWLMDNIYDGGDNISLLNAMLSNCQ